MSQVDVLSICNALMDALVEVSDSEFNELNIEKGIMHLVDGDRQKKLMTTFEKKDWDLELGGSAMNATRALAEMGSRSAFFGAIGQDDFGAKIKQRMQDLGIHSYLKETSEPTGICAILITPDGERTMNTHLGASCHYNEDLLPIEQIRNSKVLHFTGYQWSTPHQKKAVQRAIAEAKSCGCKVSFDVADPFMVSNCREDFLEVIQNDADIVFANADEARGLFSSTPEEAGKKIAAAGAIAVIKLGGDGAAIFENDKEYRINPVKTEVIDTTAAGDMFAGGFLYGYTNKKSLQECGEIAAILASDVISRVGAKLSNDAVTRAKLI